MEENTVEVFIEDKKIASVEPVEETTPLGDIIYLIKFEDGSETKMTMKKFMCMQTDHKSDATAMRAVLSKEVASRIYGMFMEYGLKFAEIDPCFNEAVRLINDGQNAALDILWNNEAYDRSLLDVNRVLLTKYGEETQEGSADNDGVASSGSPVDPENKG